MAATLEQAKYWGRQIRTEDWKDIGIPTWTLFYEAMGAGNMADALKLAEHVRDNEMDYVHRVALQTPSSLFDYIAQTYGEEDVGKAWRAVAMMRHKTQMRTSHHPQSIEEAVQIDAQLQRGHLCGKSNLGDLTVVEEKDRYVVTLDPCGTGGRLRQLGIFGVTEKAYPWSWGKTGVLYHCVHCCLYYEILPIEARGYPTRINEGGDDPQGRCIHLFYKKPELIPEHYFTRVGKKKDPSLWASPKT